MMIRQSRFLPFATIVGIFICTTICFGSARRESCSAIQALCKQRAVPPISFALLPIQHLFTLCAKHAADVSSDQLRSEVQNLLTQVRGLMESVYASVCAPSAGVCARLREPLHALVHFAPSEVFDSGTAEELWCLLETVLMHVAELREHEVTQDDDIVLCATEELVSGVHKMMMFMQGGSSSSIDALISRYESLSKRCSTRHFGFPIRRWLKYVFGVVVVIGIVALILYVKRSRDIKEDMWGLGERNKEQMCCRVGANDESHPWRSVYGFTGKDWLERRVKGFVGHRKAFTTWLCSVPKYEDWPAFCDTLSEVVLLKGLAHYDSGVSHDTGNEDSHDTYDKEYLINNYFVRRLIELYTKKSSESICAFAPGAEKIYADDVEHARFGNMIGHNTVALKNLLLFFREDKEWNAEVANGVYFAVPTLSRCAVGFEEHLLKAFFQADYSDCLNMLSSFVQKQKS